MSAVGATVQALLADPAVSSIVETRVYPTVLPQNARLSCCIVTSSGEVDAVLLSGPGDFFEARVQVDCLAAEPAGSLILGERVRAALHGYLGTIEGITTQILKAETDFTDYNENRTVFRRGIGFRVWWR